MGRIVLQQPVKKLELLLGRTVAMKGRKAMNERQNYLAEGFRNVDRQTDVEKFKICLTAMESLASFRTYKEETYQLLKPLNGRVFIDVGCGLGFDVERLAKRTSARVIGLDASYELLRDARHRALVRPAGNPAPFAASASRISRG
jgi:ubiquinone/menaquinone biosynthesis C-methylase UbiE